MRRRLVPATGFLLACVLGPTLGSGCAVDYSEDPPPSLAEAPEAAADDELVFERSLRWWAEPTSQRVRLYRRKDGRGWLLLRELWDGTAT